LLEDRVWDERDREPPVSCVHRRSS
jgi:hypothetical protein